MKYKWTNVNFCYANKNNKSNFLIHNMFNFYMTKA